MHLKNHGDNIKKHNGKLKNFSQVPSLERLADKDSEIVSQIIAGGDEVELRKDIEDNDKA
jgi:hypothetical protein